MCFSNISSCSNCNIYKFLFRFYMLQSFSQSQQRNLSSMDLSSLPNSNSSSNYYRYKCVRSYISLSLYLFICLYNCIGFLITQQLKSDQMRNGRIVILMVILVMFEISQCSQLSAKTLREEILLDVNNDFEPNALKNDIYKGIYTTPEEGLFDYITTTSGDTELMFFHDPTYDQSPFHINSLEILLFNPMYHDGRIVAILLRLNDAINGSSWVNTNQNVTLAKINKERINSQQTINNVTSNITILEIDSQQYQIVFNIQGIDFEISGNLTLKDIGLAALWYNLYVTAILCLQIGASYIMIRDLDLNPNAYSKLSLTTVGWCNIVDFYMVMNHIEYVFRLNGSSWYFLISATAFMILFGTVDLRLLFLVWRYKHIREFDSQQTMRRMLTSFYLKYYGVLFLYLIFSYYFIFDIWFMVLQAFFILPQIIHNAREGINPGFSFFYVFGYLGMRMWIPIYERSCPYNYFLLTPMPFLVLTICIIYIIQIALLFLQYYLGPRFFIPKALQPGYYKYDVNLQRNQTNLNLQCAICIQGIFDNPDQNVLNEETLTEKMTSTAEAMVTPCKHYFHKQCLMRWIEVKLQCPSCRAQLPPYI